MLPPWVTYTYETRVPPPDEAARPWPVHFHPALQRRILDRQGLGPAPTLEISDAGLTPNPGWVRGEWRPEVLRSRLTLRASKGKASSASEASFHVDRGITSRLQEGDVLTFVFTGCARRGLSVLRDGRLVVAVGAVTQVDLGTTVQARIPRDVITQAESRFRALDPTFELREWPVELTIAGRKALLPGGSCAFEDYDVSVLHGFLRGTPGNNECVAIAARGLCPATAAEASARLIDD